MEQRVSLITLGVAELERSRSFMNALDGSSRTPKPKRLCSFRLEEWLLLCIREPRLQRARTFPRMALDSAESRSRTTPASVARLMPFSRKRKPQVQKLLKPAEEASWGGFSGYFADPDGFLWEVAWNPFFPIAEDGSIRIPAGV